VATMEAAPPATAPRPRVLDGLHLGLPDHWYPILYSSQLGAGPLAVRRFGQSLAVWRDSQGAPHVFENRCAHRAAPLAAGNVQGDELACCYHGWRYNGAGLCTAMPLEDPDSPRLAHIRIKAYAAADRGGYIWMYHGDAASAPPLAVPAELEDAAYVRLQFEYVWQTNWLNVLENVQDPLHALYLHAGTSVQRRRATFKAFQITADLEDGFRMGKVGYKEDGSIGSVEGETTFTFPGTVRLDLVNGIPPKTIMHLVIMVTPIDEGNSVTYFERGRWDSGPLAAWRWRLAWLLKYRRRIERVVREDRDVLVGLGPIGEARLHEHLASSDVGVIHLRRRLNRAFAASQAHAGQASSGVLEQC
jgi:phenylpropionate dioxygenase-like ring-hydroxylating dioxygenase large terminal subunit